MPGKQRSTRKGWYSCHRVGCNWRRETTLKGWQQHSNWCDKPEPAGTIVRQDPYANTVPLSSRTTTDDNSFTSGICRLIHHHEAYQKSSEDVEMQDSTAVRKYPVGTLLQQNKVNQTDVLKNPLPNLSEPM